MWAFVRKEGGAINNRRVGSWGFIKSSREQGWQLCIFRENFRDFPERSIRRILCVLWEKWVRCVQRLLRDWNRQTPRSGKFPPRLFRTKYFKSRSQIDPPDLITRGKGCDDDFFRVEQRASSLNSCPRVERSFYNRQHRRRQEGCAYIDSRVHCTWYHPTPSPNLLLWFIIRLGCKNVNPRIL